MKKRLQQFKILKIETDRLIEKKGKNIEIKALTIDLLSEASSGGIVSIQQNQVTNQIRLALNIPESEFNGYTLIDKLCAITVSNSGKIAKKVWQQLAKCGFTAEINGKSVHFVHFLTSASNLRNNTVIFIADTLKDKIYPRLMCGLEFEDFKNFSPAKFSAYMGLNLSGCHLLPEELSPRVIIIDDYEELRPHIRVNHVKTVPVRYFCAEDKDIVLSESLEGYVLAGDHVIRLEDGEKFSVHSGNRKKICEEWYDEIDGSPEMNSFDGQGLAQCEWMQKVAEYLGINRTISSVIVRAPFVKGLLVNVDFRTWFFDHGITNITDAFGNTHVVGDFDVILTMSQVKMHKAYRERLANLGENIAKLPQYWETHRKMNNLHWGITRVNYKEDKDRQLLNYQFVQALRLDSDDVEELCAETDQLLRNLNTDNFELVNGLLSDGITEDDYAPLYQQVLNANPSFITNRWVRAQLLQESAEKLNAAKLSKLLCNGNYQTIISDPVAFLEHCAKMPVKGVVPRGYVYSNYWHDKADEIATLRSPFIDRNEILRLKVIKESNEYFSHINTGLIYSIDSIDCLAQSGCDFDGDGVASTDNQLILKGSINREDARALYYELPSPYLCEITEDTLISAEVGAFNSRVGQISNKSCALYAYMSEYDESDTMYQYFYDGIIRLGEWVGSEIDRAKSGAKLTTDLMFKVVAYKSALSDADKEGICRHNELANTDRVDFLRYKYKSTDRYDKKLIRVYNKLSVLTCGCSGFEDLQQRVESGTASAQMLKLNNEYNKHKVTLTQGCICNQVARHFEDLEVELKKNVVKNDGLPRLSEFIGKTEINTRKYNKVKGIIDAYSNNRRLRMKNLTKNGVDSVSAKAQSALIKNELRDYYMKQIENLIGNDPQVSFDYIASGVSEDIAFDFLGSLILPVISTNGGK